MLAGSSGRQLSVFFCATLSALTAVFFFANFSEREQRTQREIHVSGSFAGGSCTDRPHSGYYERDYETFVRSRSRMRVLLLKLKKIFHPLLG